MILKEFNPNQTLIFGFIFPAYNGCDRNIPKRSCRLILKGITMKKINSYSEMLRHENEITKLKIQAEFGVELKGTKDMNPALENIWLNQILEYERAMLDNTKITIGELIGSPQLKPMIDLEDDEISEELQMLMSILYKKNIVIESNSGIDEREMYRFLTEELIEMETDKNTPKNMITCFIYEEFHPNDEYDLRKYSTEFLEMFVEKGEDYWKMHLSPCLESEENEVRASNLERRLENFRESFDQLRVDKFSINTISILEETAEVNFEFSLAVMPPGNRSSYYISDSGQFFFKKELECWFISDIIMKGVV